MLKSAESTLKRTMSSLAVAALLLTGLGCSWVKDTVVVMHPDAPMFITARSRSQVRVSVYSRADNKLVDYGWVDVPVGWTLHKYDWEAFIAQQNE